MEFDLLLGIVLCCLLQSFGTFGFNIDTGKAVVFNGPRDKTSQSKYFGYSVALHSFSNSFWVLVGAPLSNVSSQYNSNVMLEKYGAVYRCNFATKACTFINIGNIPVGTATISVGNVPKTFSLEEKSGMWLGGTVYSTGTDGKALACAPRYIFRGTPYINPDETYTHYIFPLGQCKLLDKTLTRVEQNGDLDPCSIEEKSNKNYGFCEVGMDAAYSADEQDVIMGAVGAKESKGVIFRHPDYQGYNVKSVVDQIGTYDYMGYSVSSGHFTDQRRTEFVGGAPRSDGVRGKVIIYSYESGQLLVKTALPQPKNLPTGTYFGSAICAVDLDDNKYTDILVGAPYFTNVLDEGRVYIYLSNGQGALNLQDGFLEGDRKVNAHFGHAIASAGDLNADGYNDVVIGAPMEDDSGAVYIYHGSSNGIQLQYSQKILGSKVQSGLKMFGISVSGGVDVDKNKYPDIAVGAYGSENAVILRSQNILDVTGKITLSKNQIDLEGNSSLCDLEGAKHKCVNITIAFSYKDVIAATNTKDLEITYTVDLDKDKGQNALRRIFFWDAVNKQRKFTLENSTIIPASETIQTLQPQTVYLMEKNDINDVTSLLSVDLTVSLPPPPCADLCPVLNEYKPSTFRAEIPFRKTCRQELVCVPDLVVSGTLVFSSDSGDEKELKIGVVRDFTVQLIVENKAVDYAYTTKIKLKHPENLDFIGPDKGIECEKSIPDNGTITVICDVANPLQGNTKKEFGIKFRPGTVRETFFIEVEASSQDKDAQDKDNTARFRVNVKFEADVEITGSSRPDQVAYQGPVRDKEEVRKDLSSIGPEVIQTLAVRNNGPSAVDGSMVTVSFPSLYSSSNLDSYLLYLLQVDLQGSAGSCNVTVNPLNIVDIKEANETNTRSRRRRDTEEEEKTLVGCRQASCKSFECRLGLLKEGDKVEIKMTFRLWENTLLKEFDPPKAVDLETSAKVKVPDKFTQKKTDNDQTTIITTAQPAQTKAQEKKTPWWVIFLAVLGGVLLLGGAIAVLYKCGFFKRKRAKDISGPMEESVPMTTK